MFLERVGAMLNMRRDGASQAKATLNEICKVMGMQEKPDGIAWW
jgi:hypothetical protein